MVVVTAVAGTFALGLAAFGLFGILSYATATPTREIGIRMGLGATQSSVLWGVVRDALRLVCYGTLMGLPLVLVSGTVAGRVIYGASSYDPVALWVAILVLVMAAAWAAASAARRVARVTPLLALRQE